MRSSIRALVACVALIAPTGPSIADQEASNVAHVASGTYGRCYAKSVPAHVFDPDGEPRQQGRTSLYRVTDGEDVLIHEYEWFSQTLFVRCGPADHIIVVRLGPWHRGHDPKEDHLAIAFYRGGTLVRSYSTLEIAGGEEADDGGFSRYRNVSASVSHYTVFAKQPEFVRETVADGTVFRERWYVLGETVDGRRLRFDIETGRIF